MNVGSFLKYYGDAVELVDLDSGKTDLEENNYDLCTPSLPIRGSTIGLAGCGIWLFCVVILGM